ncbi:hypothetical protein [Streptomyces acidiscabies]|uniref:hypothetical protein n=2 Tax=Streptomyces acidiscabies TaxID=42234 RepID=UPI000AE35F0D
MPSGRGRVRRSRTRVRGDEGAWTGMESGPAIFAGSVFALFGGGLLVWTTVRARQRQPVAQGVGQGVAVTFATAAAVASLAVAAWCLTRV